MILFPSLLSLFPTFFCCFFTLDTNQTAPAFYRATTIPAFFFAWPPETLECENYFPLVSLPPLGFSLIVLLRLMKKTRTSHSLFTPMLFQAVAPSPFPALTAYRFPPSSVPCTPFCPHISKQLSLPLKKNSYRTSSCFPFQGLFFPFFFKKVPPSI